VGATPARISIELTVLLGFCAAAMDWSAGHTGSPSSTG
jgi:hypothetical protein